MAGKVVVVAGTQYDTALGIHQLDGSGAISTGLPLCRDPGESTLLQVLSPGEIEDLIASKILQLGCERETKAIFIYCNSISTAIQVKRLEDRMKIKIITPLKAYAEVAEKHDRIAVLAANCQAAAGIEKMILDVNKRAVILGLGFLPLTYEIEKQPPAGKIVQKLGLSALMSFYEKIGCQVLVLGCTHFPYIEKELDRITSLPIFNPAAKMIEELEETLVEV